MLVIVRLCWNRITVENALWALVLALLCYSLARATLLSQPVPLLAVLTWFALLWLRDRRDWPGGIMLGLMTAIKLFPGVLLLLFVLDRRWRPVWIAAGTVIAVYAVSLLTLGLPLHAQWGETMREFSSRVIPYWGNQSPTGWLARAVFGQNIMEGRPVGFPGLLALRIIFAMVFGGGMLAALWKHRSSLTGEYLAPAAGLILGGVLLIVPTSWEHYWLFVLPVLGWSLSVEWKRGLSWPEAIWLGGAAFFFLMKLTRFYGDSDLGRVMTGSQTVGMIVFWLWLVRRALQKPLPKTAVVVELS
jgi:alpha-1,2-mannosyltransferase